MAFIVCIVLILLGALAASSVIVAKKPDAEVQLAKLRPYQGYMGAFALVVALLDLFTAVPFYFRALSAAPLFAIIGLLAWATLFALGLFFSYDLLQTHLLKDKPEASAKLAATQARLAGYQVPIGLTGIVIGILGLVTFIIY